MKKSNLINMTLTLLLIALISGGVLGYIYDLTKEPIQKAKAEKKKKAIKSVLPDFDNDPNAEMKTVEVDGMNMEIYPAKKNGNIQGYAIRTFSKKGFSGLVWLMVGFRNDGTIHNIEVLEHQETPGLGTKMVRPKFKNQFKDKNPENFTLQVKKDGGDVDAITAATISSRAFCDAVARAYKQIEKGGSDE